MSDPVFKHLCGLAILKNYKYWQKQDNFMLYQREFYHLKDHGFIRPKSDPNLEFNSDLDGKNITEFVEPTDLGWIYIELRKEAIPADWFAAENRQNLRTDGVRRLGLENFGVG
jgi:hypothetical protein